MHAKPEQTLLQKFKALEDHYTIVRYTYHADHFGDELLEFSSPELSARIYTDRRLFHYEIKRLDAGEQDWKSLKKIWQRLSGINREMTDESVIELLQTQRQELAQALR
jgi:hypothetical protein